MVSSKMLGRVAVPVFDLVVVGSVTSSLRVQLISAFDDQESIPLISLGLSSGISGANDL
jgi:hypothetical protein